MCVTVSTVGLITGAEIQRAEEWIFRKASRPDRGATAMAGSEGEARKKKA